MDKRVEREINQTLGFKVKILNTLIEKNMNNKVAEVVPDLTHTQMSVLMFVYHSTDSVILQKDLEEILYLSHPTVRGIVKRLVKLNLIEASKLETDKRQTCLALTQEGEQLLDDNHDELEEVLRSSERILDQCMSRKDKQKLIQQLDELIENFLNN
ncbi:MarR family winged helix-turn-helix transcriptional regulator [Holzapfeliella sp. JNUCC 80]